jgi:hypothetical protein
VFRYRPVDGSKRRLDASRERMAAEDEEDVKPSFSEAPKVRM